MPDISILTPPCYLIVGGDEDDTKSAGIVADEDAPELDRAKVERLRMIIDRVLVPVHRVADLVRGDDDNWCRLYVTEDRSAWWLVRNWVAANTIDAVGKRSLYASVDPKSAGHQRSPILAVNDDGKLVASLAPLAPVYVTEVFAYLPADLNAVTEYVQKAVLR